MRIIAGKYKSRLIKMPKGIRPTQDKVRKALFDILGDLSGISFLELYAGSGAVGFEALSSGAREVVLVESDRGCVCAINDNIKKLGLEGCVVYPQEADRAISILHKNKRQFDIIFLDPPYYKELAKKTLQMLGACDIVAPNGLVVIQHFKKDMLPDTSGNIAVFRQKEYGDTVLSFYKRV